MQKYVFFEVFDCQISHENAINEIAIFYIEFQGVANNGKGCLNDF
jgi:hypothetical protein